jgi:hypothetical protein
MMPKKVGSVDLPLLTFFGRRADNGDLTVDNTDWEEWPEKIILGDVVFALSEVERRDDGIVDEDSPRVLEIAEYQNNVENESPEEVLSKK